MDRNLAPAFVLGAVPLAERRRTVARPCPTRAPLARSRRFLIVVVVGRHLAPRPAKPADRAFIGFDAASGLGAALLGSVSPLTAPFFLAYGLTRAAHIGTEAASALTCTWPSWACTWPVTCSPATYSVSSAAPRHRTARPDHR
jgi:hypothetical protein